jgi:hypothetical protein
LKLRNRNNNRDTTSEPIQTAPVEVVHVDTLDSRSRVQRAVSLILEAADRADGIGPQDQQPRSESLNGHDGALDG